jgi:hypothetical protein
MSKNIRKCKDISDIIQFPDVLRRFKVVSFAYSRYIFVSKSFMEDNLQSGAFLDPSTDGLSPSIRKRLNLDDNTEKNQQPPQSPSVLKQQLSNVAVCSLLDVETDPGAIQSLELLLNSVVKIFCTSIPCNFDSPW